MVTLQTIENALKGPYLSVIRHQIPKQNPVLTLVDGYKGQSYGKYARYMHKGVETIAELETFSVKVQFSDKALRAAQNNAGAAVELVNSELEDVIQQATEALMKDVYTNLFDPEEVDIPLKKIDIESFAVENDILFILVGKAAHSYFTKHRLFTGSGEFAGHKVMYCKSIPVILDKNIPEDDMYFVPTNSLHQQELCDWSWLERDTGHVLNQVPGKPIYEGILIKYSKIFHIIPIFRQKVKEKEDGKN